MKGGEHRREWEWGAEEDSASVVDESAVLRSSSTREIFIHQRNRTPSNTPQVIIKRILTNGCTVGSINHNTSRLDESSDPLNDFNQKAVKEPHHEVHGKMLNVSQSGVGSLSSHCPASFACCLVDPCSWAVVTSSSPAAAHDIRQSYRRGGRLFKAVN